MENLVIWFFLAIVQGEGGRSMTFGTQEECVEVRGQAATAPDVMFLSECMGLKLTPITIPKDNKTERHV